MGAEIVSGHLITSGTALAGLILVFLGAVFTAFDSYDQQGKASVRSRFRRRGVIAFVGFILCLIAVGFGFAAQWACPIAITNIGLGSLALGVIATVIVAVESVYDLFR